MIKIDTAERRHRLGHRQLLALPARRVEEAAERTVGLHSSDPATVFLAARARVTGLAPTHLEQALYDDRALLRILAMRRTMFVVPLDLAEVMNAACTRALAPAQHKRTVAILEDAGVTADGDRWVNDAEQQTLAALRDLGNATAAELSEVVPELKTKIVHKHGTMGMSTRVMFLLATKGKIVRGRPRGTWKSTLYEWAPIESWVPEWQGDLPEEESRAELIRRWLSFYGPGTMTDLKWWTGWGARVTQAALEMVGAVEVELDLGTGFVLADDLESTAESPPSVAFLPALDPTTMGWKERDWYCDPAYVTKLFDRNGNAGPTIWCDGRVVGGWAQRAEGEVVFELFEDVGSDAQATVEEEAGRLEAWLGEMVIIPRFRTPLEKRLAR